MTAGAISVVSYTIYHSPNAYLGQLAAERELGGLPVEIVRRPIYIPRTRGLRVADLVGGRESAERSSYHREDCARWAARYGVPLNLPPKDWFARRSAEWEKSPFDREELPARAYYAALGSGHEASLDRELFAAAWVRNEDVNDWTTIAACAERAGLDAGELRRKAEGPEPARLVRAALASFDADRCPGVPTWVVRGQRFWGKDRAEFLAFALRNMLGDASPPRPGRPGRPEGA
jgi:2-hydroxychromene-2-carboxylate isomerase